MISRDESVAIVVGSLILGLLKVMDKKQQIKGSTISYAELMRTAIYKSPTTKEERQVISETARDSMLMLVDQHEDEESVLQVATFIESLSFSFERELINFYGQEYLVRMLRFTEKQIVDSTIAKGSYELSDDLKDNIRKVTFDKKVT